MYKASRTSFLKLLTDPYLQTTWPSVIKNHYHPNVHECYAVVGGSSTLILGLDVGITPAEITELPTDKKYIELVMNVGDVIILPAGVSHCSKTFCEDYRYVAAYPKNGEHYKSVSKLQSAVSEGKYDNFSDIEESIKAAFPLGDPIYGKTSGCLIDIWSQKLKV